MSIATKAEADQGPERGASAASTRSTETGLTAAVKLGWRVAELYAQVNDTGKPTNDTLLPAHQSLEPGDQLELQLRAAAGDAHRAGVASAPEALERLLPYAREAPRSTEAAEAFRQQVRSWHVELAKDLWSRDEEAGKAYELGTGMSDSYSRVCRAYRVRDEEPRAAWESVFATDRIERLKKLLDDLQSRLNPAGVAVVRNHLDVWRENVPARIRAAGGPPPLDRVREGLRRQTVIWRQLIAGDKEPAAYLDSEARAALRGELRELVWRRCRRWVLPAAAVLFALIFFLPKALNWYQDGTLGTGAASVIVALAGALGITKASVLLTVRTQLHRWTELLWNRALAKKVSDETLVLDSVLPRPAAQRPSFASEVVAVVEGLRGRITRRPPAQAGRPRTSF
jgi:hypothetical protein